MLALINATLVMRDHYIPDGVLLMDNGVIADFGSAKNITIPEGAEVIDAKGLFAGPGLIDIHTHADGDTYFHDDPIKCSTTLLNHGVTSVLPALFYSMNKQEHLDTLKKYKDEKEGAPSFFFCFDTVFVAPGAKPCYNISLERNLFTGASLCIIPSKVPSC